MSDSMCCETVLNTDELASGSSSHHSAKHSVKSSYLHVIIVRSLDLCRFVNRCKRHARPFVR